MVVLVDFARGAEFGAQTPFLLDHLQKACAQWGVYVYFILAAVRRSLVFSHPNGHSQLPNSGRRDLWRRGEPLPS
jgi:hypothetical protein